MSEALAPGRIVPMNDLARRWRVQVDEILSTIRAVVDGGRAILGENVEAFEEAFARSCGVRHCVGVANGTDAIEIALRALGLGPGSRVATVANAGGYATSAIRAIGATPAYVEVEQESLSLDPSALASLIAENAVDGVVVTHLFGRMADVEKVVALARREKLRVVEDCAQAHGAELDGRPAGSWGDAAAFSFYPTKNLGALGDAGAVVTDDSGVADAVRELRQYGWRDRYQVGLANGRNSRLDEIQAAVLRLFLPRLPQWNERRRAIAARYREALAGVPLILPTDEGMRSVWHQFVIRSGQRERLRSRLHARGIATDVHYPVPDHQQAANPSSARLPVTERSCREILSLPCFPELTEEEIDAVIAGMEWAIS